ncbi:hypothetical protein SVAN01_01690 [Stagonosporopsis vannaccii]|nr:hypothetical protein SVAN01_01690 [Stagonosporopsis vannaccii]
MASGLKRTTFTEGHAMALAMKEQDIGPCHAASRGAAVKHDAAAGRGAVRLGAHVAWTQWISSGRAVLPSSLSVQRVMTESKRDGVHCAVRVAVGVRQHGEKSTMQPVLAEQHQRRTNDTSHDDDAVVDADCALGSGAHRSGQTQQRLGTVCTMQREVQQAVQQSRRPCSARTAHA